MPGAVGTGVDPVLEKLALGAWKARYARGVAVVVERMPIRVDETVLEYESRIEREVLRWCVWSGVRPCE